VSAYAEKVARRERRLSREESRVPVWPASVPSRRIKTSRAVIRQGARTVLVRQPLHDQYGGLFGYFGIGHKCAFWRFA
jgi:hypothetical protein